MIKKVEDKEFIYLTRLICSPGYVERKTMVPVREPPLQYFLFNDRRDWKIPYMTAEFYLAFQMILKKILRYILLTIFGIVGFVILFIVFSVGPVDRTPVMSLPAYKLMMNRLDTLDIHPTKAKRGFSVGFAKVNITPSKPIATAGYGKRLGKPYVTVHDSIFVRTMVVENGSQRVAIVSADLLIIPPTVTRIVESKLQQIGFNLNNTYLSATHSHNSIGHWGEGATKFIYGTYQDSVVQFIADGIVTSIEEATANLLPSMLKVGAISLPQAIENRLIDGGKEDPLLRALEVHRQDSSKLILLSYGAHATCLSQGTLELSRDYPGMLVDGLEAKDYAFAMFLAGGVGSHKGSSPDANWDCVSWMAEEISEGFMAQRSSLQTMTDSSLLMKKIPLALSDPQVKLNPQWKLRSWVFRSAFGEYKSYLTVLRIGDLVMLGTPCDFSGEFNASLDSLARAHGVRAMVTSFNGGYIGYVTPGKYYDLDHYETQLMNWYAPGTGDYIKKCLEKLIVAVSDTR
ncbi:MAG: neutral/alkaline non-lysosomal ceramidase N-terminal domain-containing protein [Cyclobacteriaceae bacterium]